MINGNAYYPIIMEPGQLKSLNEYAISTLGVPLFFVTPDPERPHTDDMCGRLYEIVTGLYIIYHDYGMRFLSSFLQFTKDKFPAHGGHSVLAHYNSVLTLRGGFCHGCIPQGKHGADVMYRMNYYFPGTSQQWPGVLPKLTDQECAHMVNALSNSSNNLVQYVKDRAQAIAQDPGMLTLWKNEVLSKVLNKDQPQYGSGKNKVFFDERVISDIVDACRAGAPKLAHQSTVQQWLARVEKKIRNGTVAESDDLSKTLFAAVYDLYHPATQQTRKSSADLLLGDFDI